MNGATPSSSEPDAQRYAPSFALWMIRIRLAEVKSPSAPPAKISRPWPLYTISNAVAAEVER